MPDRPESALAFFAPPAVAQLVNRWRSMYDPYVATIEPHITLAYPFILTAEEWLAQRAAVAACLQSFSPFRVEINRPNHFLTPGMVLWLQPEDDGTIVRMYRRLEERFPAYIEPPRPPLSFVPHMTVGFFNALDALEEAQQRIATELIPMEFEVNEVVFAAQTEPGKWGRLDGIPLGK